MSAKYNATVNFLQIIKWNRHFGADALSFTNIKYFMGMFHVRKMKNLEYFGLNLINF